MSVGSAVIRHPAAWRRSAQLPTALRRVVRWPHLPGVAAQFALGLWLCRGFTGSAIPAGTDTLGFVARAASNARADTWMSAWSPESFGAPRTVTLESLLGLFTKVTGDPVLTVKLFMLATLVASGVGAYWLTWRWYRRRLAAAVAGLLYTGSQISLAQTASGHLNVCVVLALAPIVIGLTVEGVERFSARRAVALGVALALLILARPDMALYVVPLAALYIPIRGLVDRRLGRSLRNGVLTGSLALIVALGLSLYEVVPMLGGIHAQWVSAGGLFNLQEFQARSVPALASLLAFAREIGYLAFTGRQTWTSHPWVGFGAYVALAALPVLAAWAVLAWRRDARTIYLLACAVLAAFAAKGMWGPVSGPYKWAALHVPLFGNLRDPNRWLIVGSLAVAVLAGLTADRLPELLRWLEASIPARILVALAAVGLVALPNAPTILPGLATWRPTPGQAELLSAAASGRSPLATVPFDQTRRLLSDGSYNGWEHDLGAESSLWTGRPALADGGWSPSAAGTIAYLNTLLGRRDPAFTPLLSALGVGNVLSFVYAPTAPHLLNAADPLYQQQAITTLHGLTPIRQNDAGTLLHVPAAAPIVSARPLRAVVLGGRSGLRALVRLRGFTPSAWAAEDAADILTRGGVAGLLAAVRDADLVMIADAAPQEIAVIAAPRLAQLPGISSDADRARATETLPPDVATRTGAPLADTVTPPLVGAQSSSTPLALSSAQPAAELWAQVRALPDAATLHFTLDGRELGQVTPVAPAAAGFSWVHVATGGLSAGRHRLSLAATPSPYGAAYEVNDVRMLNGATRLQTQQALSAALGQAGDRTAYADDLGDALRTTSPAELAPGREIGGGVGYWKALEPDRSALSTGTSGRVSVAFAAGRRYHALLAHYFRTPRNWSAHAYAFIRVRGQASGAVYRILIDGDAQHRYADQLVWTDRDAGWRWLALPLFAQPGIARHIVSVRIAADDSARPGRLELGALSLSPALSTIGVHLPIPASSARRAQFVDQPRPTRRGGVDLAAVSHTGATDLSVRIPLRSMGAHYLLLVPPRAGLPVARPPTVSWVKYGANRFSVTASSGRPFTLLLARSADQHWRLAGVPGAQPVRSWGTLQGWRLPPGNYHATISYPGDRLVQLGVIGSIAFGAGVALALLLWLRGKRAGGDAGDSGRSTDSGADADAVHDARVWSDWTWRVPWIIALALLIPIPIAVAHGAGPAGNALAVAAIAAMAVAVGIAALCSRRRCDDPGS
jgi:hypothetical protein